MIRIANVRLRGRKGLYTVEIKGSSVAGIYEYSGESGDINGMGNLLTESFAIPHVHIDKVETGDMIEGETLGIYQLGLAADEAIKKAAEVKKSYDPDRIAKLVTEKLISAAANGVTHMRVFVDVDTFAELRGLEGVLEARSRTRDLVDVQIVAFPQQGLLIDRGAEALVEEALRKGADVVGGIPWIERSDQDRREHIRIALELARKHGKPAAFLVDDAPDPKLRTLEMLAEETMGYGLEGRVEACHARALEVMGRDEQIRILDKVKQAGISLVTNPHTGKYHLPVQLALERGVNVALGQDDCNDAYYPYGACSPLEVSFLASHLLWMMDPAGRETLYDMITWRASAAIGVQNRLAAGGPANLVVLRRDSIKSAIRYHERPAYVIRDGAVVAENA
ncbi:MAG: amidohydrolase family protein [Nitrososphaeria archaeon]